MTAEKAKRPHPGKGYRWVEVGETLMEGDQTQDYEGVWFATIMSDKPCREALIYRRRIPPHQGESEAACYEGRLVGDDPLEEEREHLALSLYREGVTAALLAWVPGARDKSPVYVDDALPAWLLNHLWGASRRAARRPYPLPAEPSEPSQVG